MNTGEIIEKAKTSKLWLWLLNKGLHKKIPFNKPHQLWITNLGDESVYIKIPYIRSNKNHIKGLHACVLATAGEYASGLLLLSRLGVKDYRIIMESLEAKYHYQGKGECIAIYKLLGEKLKNEIILPLQEKESIYFKCETEIYDLSKNHVATIYTNWQIKGWDKVKTQL